MKGKRWRKILALTAGLIALLLVAVPGSAYLWLRTSLPQTDGTIEVRGIESPVTISRDSHGVPHVQANSEPDAYFGLGFAHAQDRLWQLEAQRRLGSGRLSEIVGEGALGYDRFFRTLGRARAAEKSLQALDSSTRTALKAYAEGINVFLAQRRGALPPEFLVLGAPAPEFWRPADSILIAKLMAWRLTRHWRDDLLRAQLSLHLTAEKVNELWPPLPRRRSHRPARLRRPGPDAYFSPAAARGAPGVDAARRPPREPDRTTGSSAAGGAKAASPFWRTTPTSV